LSGVTSEMSVRRRSDFMVLECCNCAHTVLRCLSADIMLGCSMFTTIADPTIPVEYGVIFVHRTASTEIAAYRPTHAHGHDTPI